MPWAHGVTSPRVEGTGPMLPLGSGQPDERRGCPADAVQHYGVGPPDGCPLFISFSIASRCW